MSLSLIFNHCVHKQGYRILRKVSGRELLKKSHPSKNTFKVSYSCHGGQKVGLGLQMNWWESFLVHLTTFGLHIFLHIFAHFCSFALVVSGEILLRMVVTRRSILAQRPLFAQAGIPISQSVYRGQKQNGSFSDFAQKYVLLSVMVALRVSVAAIKRFFLLKIFHRIISD